MKTLKILILIILLLINIKLNVHAQYATSEARFIKVSYELPYPGILPDNPLYFIKALRDNLFNLLISDPIKKAEYNLLMADKRLASGKMLIDKKNYQLAITTISKSANYLERAISLTVKAKQEGKNTKELLDKLFVASQKHQQIIFMTTIKTKGDVKYGLELLLVRVKSLQDTVDVIRSQ